MAISRRARSTGPGVAFAEWGPADMAMSHGFLDPRLGRSTLAAARQRVFDACKAAGIFFLDTCTEENLAAQLAAGVRISMGTRELQALARELMA